MNRHQHPSNNRAIGAPPGVPIDVCTSLPITDCTYSDGTVSMLSFWMPTREQLTLLNCGQPVVLQIVGNVHPMVSLAVDGDGTFEFQQA